MVRAERIELLNKIAGTINHDANGQFVSGKTGRLDLIKELLQKPITVISSHVDTHKNITKPFSDSYYSNGFECFSFCIPTKGEMHSNSGLRTRISTYDNYIEALCMAACV